MLDPDQRQLYVNALKPQPGYVLGEAIATTYSLDLSMLLAVPFALVLPHLDPRRLQEAGGPELFQAVRSARSKLTLFCNRGCIAAPGQAHVLYGLLEPVVVQIAAPQQGSLHAKLWLLRYESEDAAEAPVMRLVVLSRNLTHDKSWDVSLTLEGALTGRHRALNKPLVDLLRLLPECALGGVTEAVRARVERLSEQAWCTDWELPQSFTELKFHALGVGKRAARWLPTESKRLAIISPFVRAQTLAALAETTSAPVALIARAEELDALPAGALEPFERVCVLDEAATSEDGEDTSLEVNQSRPRGLHAKVYIAESRFDTHVYMGSANATDGALLAGKNLELMVELSGKTSKVPGRGIEGLLSNDGLGAMLMTYEAPAEPVVADAEVERARQALEQAIQILAAAGLELRFEPQGEDAYLPQLHVAEALALPGVASLRAWLASTEQGHAQDVLGLCEQGRAELAPCAAASATGFVAFELTSEIPGVSLTRTLNVRVTQLPQERDAHIARLIVDNSERLLRYLLGLLGEDVSASGELSQREQAKRGRASSSVGAGMLERLVRARARAPEPLREFQATLDSLRATSQGAAIVPAELLELWEAVKLPEEQG